MNSNFELLPRYGDSADEDSFTGKCCSTFLTIVSVILLFATLPISIFMSIKIIQEYERAVIFRSVEHEGTPNICKTVTAVARLGRVKKRGASGPGLFFIIPCIDDCKVVDLRTVSFDVPPQEILTKDSVTVTVDAVVYYNIRDPMKAVGLLE